MWGGWCDFLFLCFLLFSFLFFCFLFFSFLFLRRKHILPQATRGSQETFAPILPRAHCPPANEFSFWEQLSTVIGSHARTCTGAIYTAIQRLHSNSESLALSKRFRGCWASWPQRLGYFSWACFTCPVAALAPWKNHQWMERGVPLGMVCRRKVVSTDTSNLGWGGALCDGKLVFSLWSKKEGYLHINCLGMLAICLGLHTSLPDLTGHQVLGWIPFLYLTPSPSSYP